MVENGLDVVAATPHICLGVDKNGRYGYEGNIELPVLIQSLRNGSTRVFCTACKASDDGKIYVCNNPNVKYRNANGGKCFFYRE